MIGFALLSAALAEDLPWYVGLPLGQVTLEANVGDLPRENLEPLLRARQGELCDPKILRADLAILYSTGLFSGVEANVEPGVSYGPDGEPVEGVWLVYTVIPAPVVRRVEMEGVRRLGRQEVREAAGFYAGARLFPEVDAERVRERVLQRYAAEGFRGTEVQVMLEPVGDGVVDLRLQITEGEPTVIKEVRFGGDTPISERRMRWELISAGLLPGRRLTEKQLRLAQEALEDRLHEDGWPAARVGLLPSDEAARGFLVLVLVESGDELAVNVVGDSSLLARRQARKALEDEVRGRLSRAQLSDLNDAVLGGLREAGWWDASAELSLEESTGRDDLTLQLDAGRQHRLARGGVVFEGSEAFTSDYLAEALAEASPDVIARRRLTEAELSRAVGSLTELYRSRGYLDAKIQVLEITHAEGALYDQLGVRLSVDEGTRTTLGSLTLEGEAEDLEGRFDSLAYGLVGQPLSPAALRELSDQVVSTHRELGYLNADARPVTTVAEDGATADVVIKVRPGERFFLRSVIIRGTRRARRRLIEREVALNTGDPITPDALGDTRRELYETDVFSVIEMDLEGEGDRVRDLVITVQEKPAWSFEIGGGVATDEGLRALGHVTRRDIWGLGHQLSALGQIGLGYSGNEWRLDTTSPEWRAGLRYEAPQLRGREQTAYLDVLLNESEQEPAFRITRSGADAGVTLPIGKLTLALEYSVQRRILADADPAAMLDAELWVARQVAEDPLASLSFPTAPRWQGGPSLLLIDDGRDDPFNPSRGHLYSLQLDFYDPLTSDAWGVRALGQAQWLRPVGPVHLQLRGRVGAGAVRGRGTTLPLEDRFRLGGSGSMRGYQPDTVGPKNLRAADLDALPESIRDLAGYVDRGSAGRWVPTGGDSLVLGTVEVVVPFPVLGLDGWSSTSAVLFTDVGNVFFLDPTVFTSSQLIDPEPLLRYGVGVGIHQATPVGPLSVDLGFNPVYFQAAWSADRGEVPVRLHISLGAL